MCFSANASFGAGILLTVIGVASIKQVQEPNHRYFAAIPLIFAIQQLTEGFVWLSFDYPGFRILQAPSTILFLFIAQSIWPVFVPLSILLMEDQEKRKSIGKILVAIGVIVVLYLTYCLIVFPVKAEVIGYHIQYTTAYPKTFRLYGGVFYLLATILPPFLSSRKYMWTLGIAILISYFMTLMFYNEYIISVWCFFASIISITVYAVLHRIKSPKSILLKVRSVY
jgi:hypothetical protein